MTIEQRDIVGLLRGLERHGEDNIWRTARQAREEIETLRGERDMLVRLLVEADKVVSTVDGECLEESEQLANLLRAIAAATIPHRPEEADLLSLRACLGA